MRTLGASFLLILAACSATGCAAPQTNYVPWWKGVPATILAPSSQEAYGWRIQREPGQQPPFLEEAYEVVTPDEVSPSETP